MADVDNIPMIESELSAFEEIMLLVLIMDLILLGLSLLGQNKRGYSPAARG